MEFVHHSRVNDLGCPGEARAFGSCLSSALVDDLGAESLLSRCVGLPRQDAPISRILPPTMHGWFQAPAWIFDLFESTRTRILFPTCMDNPAYQDPFSRRMFPSCLLKVNHLGVDDSPTADSLHPILKILIRASWMIRLFEWFLSQNGSSVFHALK